MAEYVNYLRVFGAPGAARALFGAIQDDTAGLGSVDLNRITPMPVWMREEPLSAGTVRRQGGENCWLDWRQANWGTRWNTLKAQASAAAYDGGDTILFYTQDAGVPVLMQHASRLCPDAALLYAWASRDVGMDCGAARYRDGEILEQICPRPVSRRAYELSFDILREPPEAFGLFETGAVKAKANAVLGRFGVRGIKVCEGKSGLFVAMPSYKSAKGKYIDIFFPMDKEAKEELAGAVLRAYAEKQAENAAAAALAGQEPG